MPAACFSSAAATACLTVWLFRSTSSHRAVPELVYEADRIGRLRSHHWAFRFFESHINSLAAAINFDSNPESRFAVALRSTADTHDWTVGEYMATKVVEGLLVGATIFGFVTLLGFWQLGVLLGGGLVLAYPFMAKQSILGKFEKRLRRQRVRWPFVIDQIALMMQAGGNFDESLRSIADEDPDHPLTEELRRVLGDLSGGRTRRDALSDLKSRIPDPEIGELISSIIKGEELGTPLSTILAEQADQMRVKRSQWGEKAAAEAEVQIVFPGMLVMIACLIVVLGPILLPAVMNLIESRN
tara:strand:+ start:252671 stop:253567 length:897 start_codon:yes stop_codon:yes gene_type:complete